MMNDIREKLEALSVSGNLRMLPDIRHDGKYVLAEGKRMLNLSSNDYLGIASDLSCSLMHDFLSEIARACGEHVPEEMLLTSSSSRLLTGTFSVHTEVEEELCRLSGRESALTFGSGYHINSGILPAVAESCDLILADKLVHASLIDGIRLSAAKTVRFRHQDLDQAESLVEKYRGEYRHIIIVTESIFSMDGDVTDLVRLVGLKHKYPGVVLYLDEAHAAGVRGSTGMGLAQEYGVMGDVDFLCGTFGKALASAGAYVFCSRENREYLVNKARTLIFTTALPPLNALWTLKVLRALEGMGERRETLEAGSRKIRLALGELGLECPSESHIIPVMAGDSTKAVALAERMRDAGFYLLPVRPPTVPEGTARLRISMTSAITPAETDRLIETLRSIV